MSEKKMKVGKPYQCGTQLNTDGDEPIYAIDIIVEIDGFNKIRMSEQALESELTSRVKSLEILCHAVNSHDTLTDKLDIAVNLLKMVYKTNNESTWCKFPQFDKPIKEFLESIEKVGKLNDEKNN